ALPDTCAAWSGSSGVSSADLTEGSVARVETGRRAFVSCGRSDNGDPPHDTNARRPVSTLATEPSVRSQSVLLAIGTVVAACATATKVDMSSVAPSPDRRVGLRAGWMNAAEASWNLRLVSAAPKPAQFTDDTNPGDFAFLN